MKLSPGDSIPPHEIKKKQRNYFLFLGYESSLVLSYLSFTTVFILIFIYYILPKCKAFWSRRRPSRVHRHVFSPQPTPLLVQILREEEKAKCSQNLAHSQPGEEPSFTGTSNQRRTSSLSSFKDDNYLEPGPDKNTSTLSYYQ